MSPSSEHPAASIEVLVEARDLDTDERSVTRFEIEPPSGADSERRELERLVSTVHPSARIRSFAGGAATFVDRQHLVVAHYARQVGRGRLRERPDDGSDQNRLFVL